MNKWITFACISLLFIQIAYSSTVFDGRWDDSIEKADGFGGSLYICSKNDTIINGLYSEVGILVGTMIDTKTVQGEFFEGGGDKVSCSRGAFQFTISENERTFTGFYVCYDNPVIQHSWNSTRISTDVPTPKQCALQADSGDATGHWFDSSISADRLDFCASSTKYQYSYKKIDAVSVFGEGNTYHNGLIASGVSYSDNFDGSLPGASLWYIGQSGDIYHIHWTGLGKIYYRLVADPDFHTYKRFNYAGRTTNSDCRDLHYLSEQPYDYYPFDDILQYYNFFYYYSEGSNVAISFIVMSVIILVAMF